MPRRFRGKGKRKAMTRPRRRAPKRTLVNRALHPIPQRYITKMKYADAVNTDGTGAYYFNLNSIFDPNRTGVGHQPYGFDTLATLYNRYRVIACGWRITAPQSSAGSIQTQVAALPSNQILSIGTLSEVRENPRAKYITQVQGGQTVVLSGKCYIPSLIGRTRAQYMADDDYQALVTANPNEMAILNVFTSVAGGINDFPGSAPIQITLEYTVEFFDIKSLAQS